jgi:hypothetical protein
MNDNYLQLRGISFTGPKDKAELSFKPGVNVICGASDTGKSFLADSIDFMLGGSKLKDIPECEKYDHISLELSTSDGKDWKLCRSSSAGNFLLIETDEDSNAQPQELKQSHVPDKTNNLSGFLLSQIGLLGKRILSNKAGKTQSLSFRNLARLIIVQEGEIQQSGSPFWSGQFTTKTPDIATVKLLLTGIDDSAVVPDALDHGQDNAKQVALIDELLADLVSQTGDSGEDREECAAQLERLNGSIEISRKTLSAAQRTLDDLVDARRRLFEARREITGRLGEISDLLIRFNLLAMHYDVDLKRLTAIQESGSIFAYIEQVSCPLCGAPPDAQHLEETCDGNVQAIVAAATAEIEKIRKLQAELKDTVADLKSEAEPLNANLTETDKQYEEMSNKIQETVAPEVSEARASFSALVEERASVQKVSDLFAHIDKLLARKAVLILEEDTDGGGPEIVTGIPESVAHTFSSKISNILKAWNFPGECHVYYDKKAYDFVIDGKPRGSRGKGLRAITHAAVTIGLLEFCQEKGLSHPGLVVLDSPLLAYFEPEGEDDIALKGTGLKERFYEYLVEHHGEDSQIILIENQHPPVSIEPHISLTIFTGNPKEGRYGLL